MGLSQKQQQILALASARKRAADAQTANAPPEQPASPKQDAPQVDTSGVLDQRIQIPFTPISMSLGDVASAANTLGDTASFGIAPAISRTVQNFLKPGMGTDNQAKIDAVNADHPLGVAAGLAASVPVSAMLTAPLGGIGAEGTTMNALARGGGVLGDLGRGAVLGAAAGGTEAAARGEDAGGIGTSAVIGGALGPVASALGGVVGGVARKVGDKLGGRTSAKAWRYIAKKLGEDPDEIVARVATHRAATGADPSIQQIVNGHDAGAIAQFGAAYPQAGEVLNAGADATEAALPTAARGIVDNARATLPPSPVPGINPATATHADILNARGAAADAAMAPIEHTPVNVEIAPTQVRSIMRRLDPDTRAYVHDNFGIAEDGTLNTTLTVRQIDDLRQDLNNASFGVGLNKRALGELSDALESQARDQVPAYGTMIDNFAAHSQYAAGFGHGASGAERGAATDPALRASLASAHGENGYQAGLLARTSQKAAGTPASAAGVLGNIARPGAAADQFASAAGAGTPAAQTAAQAQIDATLTSRAATPGALRPRNGNASDVNLAMGAAVTPVAPIAGMRAIGRGIAQLATGTRLSPAAQREIANALVSTNPAVRDAAIEHLRRAGVSANRLRQFQNNVAKIMSASAVSGLSGKTPPTEITVHGGAAQ